MKFLTTLGGLIIVLLSLATAESCLGYRLAFGWTATYSCKAFTITLTCWIILAMIGVAIYSLAGLMEPIHKRERRIDTPPDA